MHSDSIQIQDDSIAVVVVLTGLFFAFITCFIIYFVVLYRHKQLKNKKEQEQLQSVFSQELLKTQVEIQEQTLEHISREIHDNITQVLSFVKLTLAMAGNAGEKEKQLKINESRELIAQSINDLRDLSKSLSFDHIAAMGLAPTIEIEVKRINKSGVIDVSFVLEGEVYSLGVERELVLFRILQEALNNALKHSGAKHFKIMLQYHSDLFNLTLEDDGSGFSSETLDNKSGSGLKNMENRATLIGGIAKIDSAPGKGCCVKVSLNTLKQQFYDDGRTHPDRPS
jgi:signal transduction histidine kinase